MYRWLFLTIAAYFYVICSAAAASDFSRDSAPAHADDGQLRLLRLRKSPSIISSWSYGGAGSGSRYSARSTRTFSTDEIDAFNQGLHRKRPKFIGKRQAIDESDSRPTAEEVGAPASGCASSKVQTVENEKVSAAEKRNPPRKFLGRRSWPSVSNNLDETYDNELPWEPSSALENDVAKRQEIPRRKFVGKRPASRKFVGRRSSTGHDDAFETTVDHDVDELIGADQQSRSDSEQHESESKRANRKFVG